MNPIIGYDPDGGYTIQNINGHYGFFYSGAADYVVYCAYKFLVKFSGLYTSQVPEGEIENSLRPSVADGLWSSFVDLVSLGVSVASLGEGRKLAYTTAGHINTESGIVDIAKMNPLFEIYMAKLTEANNPLFSSSIDGVKEMAEWANDYGRKLYNNGVETDDDVKRTFYSDFREKFGYDDE